MGGCEFKASLKSETLFQKANEKLTAFTLLCHLPALYVGWSCSRRKQYNQRLDRKAGPCAQ